MKRWIRAGTTPQQVVLRAKIVRPACAGSSDKEIAAEQRLFGETNFADAAGTFSVDDRVQITYALTGAKDLALFRASSRGVAGINDLITDVPITILAHGAYDALLDLPDLDDTGFLAMIVFIGFRYLFFNRSHPLRNNVRMTISLTGAFVAGVSLLAATVIAFQFATLGPGAGASLIFGELLGSAILLVLFFRQFNEPLTA